MTYTTLFFDADDTLFDFKRSEHAAFKALAEHYQWTGKPAHLLETYKRYNAALWEGLEQGHVDKTAIPTERFRLFLSHFAFQQDPVRVGEYYLDLLSRESHLLEGAYDTVAALSEKYKLAIVTNGIERVQRGRMARSPIQGFFETVVISEAVGVSKPDPRFFTYAMHAVGLTDVKAGLVIGDSLTSDISGGARSAMDTCWYNPKGEVLPEGVAPTYVIGHLKELLQIL